MTCTSDGMHSVTKHFYKSGWRVVNIEPLRSRFESFERERARDVNLNVAVGDASGKMRFFELMEESYLSTPDPITADQFRARGGTVTEHTVAVCRTWSKPYRGVEESRSRAGPLKGHDEG